MQTVEHTIWIEAPREQVWNAITQPEHLHQWYVVNCHWEIPTLQDFASVGLLPQLYTADCLWEIPSLQPGEMVKFHNGDVHLATIEVLNPPYQFTLRWQSLVTTYILEAKNNGTLITITESEYNRLPHEIRLHRFHEANEGYAMSVENLKAYLEGREIPY